MPFHAEVLTLGDTDDLEHDLGELARRLVSTIMQPQVLRLRRLVIGEASRFPELGRTYYERGPQRTVATLTAHFRRLAERGLLRLDDPELAAGHFLWLISSIPLNVVMLCGDEQRFTAAELDNFADTGTRAFLAAYARS